MHWFMQFLASPFGTLVRLAALKEVPMKMLRWIALVWCVLALEAGLSGCTVRAKPTTLTEQPITSPARPFRMVEVCLDTPPLFPAVYFRKAAGAVADRIDES